MKISLHVEEMEIFRVHGQGIFSQIWALDLCPIPKCLSLHLQLPWDSPLWRDTDWGGGLA